jgi:hypothetical protein
VRASEFDRAAHSATEDYTLFLRPSRQVSVEVKAKKILTDAGLVVLMLAAGWVLTNFLVNLLMGRYR